MGPPQHHIYPILNTFHLLNNSGRTHGSAKTEGIETDPKKYMFARMHTDRIEVLHGTQAYTCSPMHAKVQGIATGGSVPLCMISLLLSNPCTCSLIKDDQLELSLIDDNHVTLKLTLQLKPTSSDELVYSLISTLLTGSMGLLFQVENHEAQGQHQSGDHSQDHSDMDAHGYDLKYEKSHLDLTWLASLHRHPSAIGPFQNAARISCHLHTQQLFHQEKSKTRTSFWTPASNASASFARVLTVAALSDRIMKQVLEMERKRKQKEHQRKLDMRAAVRQVKHQALVGKREVKTKAVFVDTQQLDDDDDDDDAVNRTVHKRQSEYSKTKNTSDDHVDEQSTALQHRDQTESGLKNQQENQTRDRDGYQDERLEKDRHEPKDDVTPVKQTKKRPCEATPSSTSTATGSRTQPKKRRRRTGRLV